MMDITFLIQDSYLSQVFPLLRISVFVSFLSWSHHSIIHVRRWWCDQCYLLNCATVCTTRYELSLCIFILSWSFSETAASFCC
jgi:hypothetical protein